MGATSSIPGLGVIDEPVKSPAHSPQERQKLWAVIHIGVLAAVFRPQLIRPG